MGFFDAIKRMLPRPFLNNSMRNMTGFYKSIGEQIDSLQEAVIDGQNQLFIDTATWALPIYEAEFAIKLVDQSNAVARRNNVMAMSRGGLGATPLSITNVLKAYGYSTQLLEDFAGYTITIQFNDFRGVPPNLGDLQTLMTRFIPAHLLLKWKFIYTQHRELRSYTHAQMKSMTHDTLRTQLPKG
ncbi:putative phage tail protein [Tumebacillus flagellatus]|uniref:Uncharacterized protein n=1 Tax=Tumebacillus flagellatus TaxID=1157490 RepID=A0A074LMB9_9BACL|nr:putative phage tail protein [Tumebacillus flagellatus]KEO81028.1 hypothetical protein EL26_22885 [Tumebacillus flagellatus]